MAENDEETKYIQSLSDARLTEVATKILNERARRIPIGSLTDQEFEARKAAMFQQAERNKK